MWGMCESMERVRIVPGAQETLCPHQPFYLLPACSSSGLFFLCPSCPPPPPRPTYCFTPLLSTPLGQFYADEGLVCLSLHPDLCLRPQTCTLHLSPCWWGPHRSVSTADSSPSPVNQCLFPPPVMVLLNLLWRCPCSPAPRSSRPEWEPNAAIWPRCNPEQVTSSLRAGFQTSKIEAPSRSKHRSLDGAARDLKPVLRLGNTPAL